MIIVIFDYFTKIESVINIILMIGEGGYWILKEPLVLTLELWIEIIEACQISIRKYRKIDVGKKLSLENRILLIWSRNRFSFLSPSRCWSLRPESNFEQKYILSQSRFLNKAQKSIFGQNLIFLKPK